MTPTNLATSLLAVSDRIKDATDPGKMEELEAELRAKGLEADSWHVRELKLILWGISEEFASLREAVRTKFNIKETGT